MATDGKQSTMELSTPSTKDSELVYLNNEKREIMLYGYIRKTGSFKETPIEIVKLIVDFYGLIRSNLRFEANPLTMNRMRKIKQGMAPSVHFYDKVTVHTIPFYDASRKYNWMSDDNSYGKDEDYGCSCCMLWSCLMDCFCCCCPESCKSPSSCCKN